jgi:hypothetical protein
LKATEDALTNHGLTVDSEAAARDPALLAKNANLMRSYSNLTDVESSGSPRDVAGAFASHVKDNLLWLYDQVPPDIAARSQNWYDGFCVLNCHSRLTSCDVLSDPVVRGLETLPSGNLDVYARFSPFRMSRRL